MRITFLILFVTYLASSCGTSSPANLPANDADLVEQDKQSQDVRAEEGGQFDHLVEPPAEYYDHLFDEGMKSVGLTGFALVGDDVHILFLDFDGANLRKGYKRGESFILCSQQAAIPASGYSQNEQDQIVSMVQNYYDNAMAKILVTNNQPQSGDYTTIVVGGTYRDLGCLRGNGILGVAPFDKGNNNKNDIGFAFVRGGQSVFLAATTIAHEAGHSFGLDHISNNTAIMNPSHANGITGFKEGRIAGGFGRQDSPQVLQASLGVLDPNMPRPTPVPPSQPPVPSDPANPNPPAPGGNTPGNIPGLPGLDDLLAGLPGLDILGNLGSLLGGVNPNQLPIDLSQLIAQVGGLVPGGLQNAPNIGGLPGLDNLLATIMASAAAGTSMNGASSNMSIDQLLQLALAGGGLGNQGIGNWTDLIGLISQQGGGSSGLGGLIGRLIGGLIGGGTTGGNTTPNIPATLPDFSSLLGLTQFQTVEDLTWAMRGHSQVVNQNFSGSQKDALSTLVKLAYLQRYQALQR